MKINHLFFIISLITLEVSFQSCQHDYSDAFISEYPKTKASMDADESVVTKTDIESYISYAFNSGKIKQDKIKDISPYPSESDNPCFYFVNYEPEGYGILSADKRAMPLITYSETGYISEQTLVPAMKFWLDYNVEIVQKALSNGVLDAEMKSNMDFWRAIQHRSLSTKARTGISYFVGTTEVIDTVAFADTLLQTRWGQNAQGYWNEYCPTNSAGTAHCPAGCGPVAAGQILYYLHVARGTTIRMPNSATCHGSSPTSFSAVQNDSYIDLMPMSCSDNNTSNRNHARIFLAYLGAVAGAEYRNDSTRTTLRRVVNNVFRGKYGLAGIITNYNTQHLVLSLNDSIPVYVSGASADSTGGHAWVIDGIKYFKITTTLHYYISDNSLNTEEIEALTLEDCNEEESFTEWHKSCHMNWGWDGLNNNWFGILPDSWVVGNHDFGHYVEFYWDY